MPKKKRKHKSGKAKKAAKKIDASLSPRNPQTNVQGCGSPVAQRKNPDKPCDVTLLEVNVTTGKDTVADFQASARRIYEPAPDKAPDRIKTDLGSYDFVIEAISADPSVKDSKGGPATEEVANAAITTAWYGSCPLRSHPLVTMHPTDSRDSSLENQWHSATPPKTKLPGRNPGFMAKEFGWRRFPKREPMPIEITASSCGVRFDKTPVNELKSLLRIYPKDEWKIELKLPALSERKYGRSKSKDLKSGETTTEKQSSHESLGSPVTKSAQSVDRDASGKIIKGSFSGGSATSGSYLEHSLQVESGAEGSSSTFEQRTTTGNPLYGRTSTTGFVTTGDGEAAGSETEIKPSLTVSRNGSELSVTKVVNSIINVIQTGTEAFYEFEKLLKIVPKIGYTLDMSLVFLEGSISYARGYRVSKTLKSDRYTVVTSYVDLGGTLKIIEASIELGIGFDITVPNIVDWFATKNIFEVLVKLAGSITAKCELELKAQTQDDETETEIELKPVTGLKVYLAASAMLLGVGIRTEAGVTSDGLYVSGKVAFSIEAPATFSIDTGLSKGDAYAYYFVDGIIWDSSGQVTLPLWDEKKFYEGQFPNASAAAAASGGP